MFNLETAIAEWRRQMRAAGIKTPVPLEELESHLCEDIERQMKAGAAAQKAFKISVRQVGEPTILNNEFRKNERTLMKNTKRTLAIILTGIAGVLIGTSMILPALRQYHDHGMIHNAVVGFSWGIPIVLLGAVTTIFGFKKQKA